MKRRGEVCLEHLFIFLGGITMRKESDFQAGLIKDIKQLFPGCIVIKNDASYIQGMPDLTIFYKKHWATLECKKSAKAPLQPNQEYYVKLMNDMSYSAFIFPENKEVVLHELEQTFKS
jgi:hypothetical protein